MVCSTYCHKLGDIVYDAMGTSAGAVIKQMKDAGANLRPAVRELQNRLQRQMIDCSSPKLELLWQRTNDTPADVKCDNLVLALLPESWMTFDSLNQEQQQQQQDEQEELQQLQELYGGIRAVIAKHKCQVRLNHC